MDSKSKQFMRQAIQLSLENIKNGGGPFGAVIVRNGQVIAQGTNRVTLLNDPTAHAEVIAIRKAAQVVGSFDLSDCEIYSSCEPCPMCLGAIYWARLRRIYYGNSKHDAAQISFDDAFIYDELELPLNERKVAAVQLLPDEAILAFDAWSKSEDKIEY